MKRSRRGEVGEQHVEVLLAGAVDVARANRKRRCAQLLLGEADDSRLLAVDAGSELA